MLPRFRAGAFWVFALAFIGTLLLGDTGVGGQMRLDAAGVAEMSGWWQPLTAPWVYPEWSLFGVGLTFVVQWIAGSRLNELWGTRRYLIFAVVAGIVAYAGTVAVGLAWPAVNEHPPTGTTPIDVATLVAFGVAFRNHPLPLPGANDPVPSFAIAAICALPVIGSPVFSGAGGVTTLVPVSIAAVVAVLFVRPWRGSGKTGKVKTRKKNGAGLRLVHSADDLLH